MLREKDPETTGFAIYSNQLKQSLHLEGNIKTGKLIIEQDHPQNLNQDDAVISQNAVTATIEAAVKSGFLSDKDRTFYFAIYSQKTGEKLDEFSITIPAGESRASLELTSEKVPNTFAEKGAVCVYELTGSGGNRIENGEKLDPSYTVTYSSNVIADDNESGAGDLKFDNYIGTIQTPEGKVRFVPQNYFDQGIKGYHTYFENLQNHSWVEEDPNDLLLEFGSSEDSITGRIRVGDYQNIDPSMQYLTEKSGITEEISENLRHLGEVSGALAGAHNGAAEGKGSLSVINLVSTTGDLIRDLDAANFKESQNGAAIADTIRENGYLLINIDVTGQSTYTLDQFKIDGLGPDDGNEELARHVIYNFVTRSNPDGSSSSSFKPYTGKITIGNLAGGLLLAPAASYTHNGGFRGEVIADSVDFTAGAEIHRDPIDRVTKVTKQVEISNDVKAVLCVSKGLRPEKRGWNGSSGYSFLLRAADAQAPMPDGSRGGYAAASQSNQNTPASFGEITFTKPGTYEYIIEETVPADAVNGIKDGIKYDSTEHTAKVTVDSDGRVAITYDGQAAESLAVTNEYVSSGEIQLSAGKVLT